MRNKYKNLSNYLICLSLPIGAINSFTVGEKYKIKSINGVYIKIVGNSEDEMFNLHSTFGDCFCSVSYLRKKKLNSLNNI